MTGTPAAADKATLRRALLAARRVRPAAEREAAGQALGRSLAPVLPDGPVAAFLALPDEPPTGPLLEALAGRTVLLPVLQEDGDLDWALAGPPPATGRAGTRHPAGPLLGPDAVAGCTTVLVPALAVDRRGVRLGRGGGSYDRALRRARGAVVAVVFDDELVDRLPEQPHDVRVGAVATPSGGLVRLPGTMGP